jgi:hypothetical protein
MARLGSLRAYARQQSGTRSASLCFFLRGRHFQNERPTAARTRGPSGRRALQCLHARVGIGEDDVRRERHVAHLENAAEVRGPAVIDAQVAPDGPSEFLHSLHECHNTCLRLRISAGRGISTPMRRTCSCARAVSGHAAAAPPRSVRKSRLPSSGRDVRFIARPPHRTVTVCDAALAESDCVAEDAVRSEMVSGPNLPAICDLQGHFRKLQGDPIHIPRNSLQFQYFGTSNPDPRSREHFWVLQGRAAWNCGLGRVGADLEILNDATVILHSTSVVNGARVRDAEPSSTGSLLSTPPALLASAGFGWCGA